MFPLSYSTTQLSVDDVAVARPAQAAVHQAAEGIAALVEVFPVNTLIWGENLTAVRILI